MRRSLTPRSLALGVLLAGLSSGLPGLGLPAAAQDTAPFTETQRAAIDAQIRDYLLRNPEVLLEAIQTLQDRQKAAEAQSDRDLVIANHDAIYDDGFSQTLGNPEGSFTIVEFMDYQCGYCRKAFPDLANLIEQDGDIRLIVKELPILGPGSERAARVAIATEIVAGPEAYVAVHNGLMQTTGELTDMRLDALLSRLGQDPAAIRAKMQDPEVTRRINETRALAQTLQINGTPTFIMYETMLRGYLPADQMGAMVTALRADN